jgi:uncharacterized membrane protein YozB (DUF420 family)
MSKSELTAKEKRVEVWFEIPMIAVTLILIVTLTLPIIFELEPAWMSILAIMNLVIWSTFYIELFTKFFVAKSKKAALRRNWSLLAITVIPLFLPLRLIMLSRLASLVRLDGIKGNSLVVTSICDGSNGVK